MASYRSTPHRVRNLDPSRERLSMPLFYDPRWEATLSPLDKAESAAGGEAEPAYGDVGFDPSVWHELSGASGAVRWGDYLMRKVAKVFPTLLADGAN